MQHRYSCLRVSAKGECGPSFLEVPYSQKILFVVVEMPCVCAVSSMCVQVEIARGGGTRRGPGEGGGRGPRGPGFKVRVTRLPGGTSWQDLKDLARQVAPPSFADVRSPLLFFSLSLCLFFVLFFFAGSTTMAHRSHGRNVHAQISVCTPVNGDRHVLMSNVCETDAENRHVRVYVYPSRR